MKLPTGGSVIVLPSYSVFKSQIASVNFVYAYSKRAENSVSFTNLACLRAEVYSCHAGQ